MPSGRQSFFAEGGCGHDRRHGNSQSRRLPVRGALHLRDHRVQRERRLAAEDEDLAHGLGLRAAKDDPVAEILDVAELVHDVATADHDEAAARDALEELEETRVAGTVDTEWTEDGALDAEAGEELTGEHLAFDLGLAVEVRRIEGRVFVRRLASRVAVYAHGAAVDDPAYSALRGGLDHVSGSAHVDRRVVGVGDLRLAKRRGHVIDRVAAREGLLERGAFPEIAHHQAYAQPLQRRRVAGATDERGDPGAAPHERRAEVATGEAASTRDEGVCSCEIHAAAP